MDYKIRTQVISMAVLLFGVLGSGTLFFLNWAFGDRYSWNNWLMSLSYAVFIGSALIAFILQLGIRYRLPRWRVVGFFMIIGWVAGALFTTTLDSLTFLSVHVVQGISYIIVLGGLGLLVLPGFALMLFPWPPRFLLPKNGDTPES